MKSILLCFLIIFPLLRPAEFKAKVTSIKDGDTIEVLHENKPIRIRLNGIDCPEKDQDFGQKAKQFTSELCFGKEVKIISHGEDRYGRTLGDVIFPDGRILNQELVKAGLAWHYKRYSNDTILSNLEIEARNQKKGLWTQTNAIAPWDYRKTKQGTSKAQMNVNQIDTALRYQEWKFQSSKSLVGGISGHSEIEIIDFKEKGLISIISESRKVKKQPYKVVDNELVFMDKKGIEIPSNAAFKITRLTKDEMILTISNKFVGDMEDTDKSIFEFTFSPKK